MNAALIVAIVIAAATLLGSVRAWRRRERHWLAIVVLQVGASVLLYLCLFPPETQEDYASGELTVLTPDTTPQQLAALPPWATVVALPGTPPQRTAERVPDLATALRRHPATHRLHVVGAGLPRRDQDAARGLVADFDAAPLPRGLVELDVPATVRVGNLWRVSGRVEASAQGHVELRDPAGAVVATAVPDARGRFELEAQAKVAGQALFALKAVDKDATVDDVAVPLVARAGEPLKLLVLAGAPDADLKYLRRWAVDAGVQLESRVGLSEGIALTEGAAALDADALRAVDIVIVDERAWAALNRAQKQLLTDALRAGLGVLLRATGPLPAPVAEDWAALGFRVRPSETAAAVSLTRVLGLGDADVGFTRRPLDVEASAAAPLLRGDDAAPLGLWRNEGSGRVALWWLADSYRLALSGSSTRFGSLWSRVLTTLARAHGASAPVLPNEARVDRRAVLCGLAPDAWIETAQATRVDLSIERAATSTSCAAYWPEQSGWHALVSGAQRWPFYVRAASEALPLQRAADTRATQALLGTATMPSASAQRSVPLPRWPFFLGWLAAMVALWWLERRSAAAQ